MPMEPAADCAFDRACALERVSEGTSHATLTDDWMQGRGVYGGLVGALLVRALSPRFEDRPLRTLHVSFLAPAVAGPAVIRTEVERAGRSVGTGLARLEVGGTTAATAMATFAAPRRSAEPVYRAALPPGPPPSAVEDGPEALYFPTFCQHLELRQALGPAPFGGGEEPRLAGWCRFREPPRPDAAMLVALADAWPPAAMGRAGRWRGAASIDLTVTMLHTDLSAPPQAYWGFDARATVIEGGYADERATLYTEDHEPVATVRQLIALFG